MSSHEFEAHEFADLATALHSEPTPTATADQIVIFAQRQLDADWAGITLIAANGRLTTLAASDPVVEAADVLQNEVDEGPSLDRSWRGQTLVAADIRTDPRWPRWGPKAAELGITSTLAVELTSDTRRIGCINLYSRARREFSADDVAYAHICGRHAALALQASITEANLHVALDARKLIGQAQGILMERHGLTDVQAFEVLRRYSQDHNVKLRKIAEGLVATRKLPPDARVAERRPGTGSPRTDQERS